MVLAAIFILNRKGLMLWTGGSFMLLTHLHIFLSECALCGYVPIWMAFMFFRRRKFSEK